MRRIGAPCSDRRADDSFERHTGDFNRILHGEEEPALRALPRRESEDVFAIDGDGTAGYLVFATAHQRVGQRRLTRSVRTHERVDLTGAHFEVDSTQNLVPTDGRVQIADAQDVTGRVARVRRVRHGSTTDTSLPSTWTVYTGTGWVAGSVCG